MSRLRRILRRMGLRRPAFLRRLSRSTTDRLEPLTFAILRVVSRSAWASSVYYGLFSHAFRREHQAVLAGRMRYHDDESSGGSSIYLLRRNVHRIEKGLIMRPRREVFATDYLGETVESYCRLSNGATENGHCADELSWAGDVLGTYFDVTGADPVIDAARSRYESAISAGCAPQRAPFQRDLSVPPPVRFEDLHSLARRRRSVRWFEPRPVPRQLIDRALEVAVQAPSACNRQPYHFRIFDESELVRKIAAIPMGTTGFSDNIPSLAVVVGEQKAYFDERDRHVIYIDGALASMSFLFALESLGLSSCCINWPDKQPQESQMKAALGLRTDERVIMLIAIGYPDPEGMVPYSQKRRIDSVRSYNQTSSA